MSFKFGSGLGNSPWGNTNNQSNLPLQNKSNPFSSGTSTQNNQSMFSSSGTSQKSFFLSNNGNSFSKKEGGFSSFAENKQISTNNNQSQPEKTKATNNPFLKFPGGNQTTFGTSKYNAIPPSSLGSMPAETKNEEEPAKQQNKITFGSSSSNDNKQQSKFSFNASTKSAPKTQTKEEYSYYSEEEPAKPLAPKSVATKPTPTQTKQAPKFTAKVQSKEATAQTPKSAPKRQNEKDAKSASETSVDDEVVSAICDTLKLDGLTREQSLQITEKLDSIYKKRCKDFDNASACKVNEESKERKTKWKRNPKKQIRKKINPSTDFFEENQRSDFDLYNAFVDGYFYQFENNLNEPPHNQEQLLCQQWQQLMQIGYTRDIQFGMIMQQQLMMASSVKQNSKKKKSHK